MTPAISSSVGWLRVAYAVAVWGYTADTQDVLQLRSDVVKSVETPSFRGENGGR